MLVSVCIVNLNESVSSGRVSKNSDPRRKFLCKVVKHLTILGEGPAATNNSLVVVDNPPE